MESSTNAFHKTCTKSFALFLEYPKDVRYMPLLYQQNRTPPLPKLIWGMRILGYL
jgi:hypothetical protein